MPLASADSDWVDLDGLNHLDAISPVLERRLRPERRIDHKPSAVDVQDPKHVALTGFSVAVAALGTHPDPVLAVVAVRHVGPRRHRHLHVLAGVPVHLDVGRFGGVTPLLAGEASDKTVDRRIDWRVEERAA